MPRKKQPHRANFFKKTPSGEIFCKRTPDGEICPQVVYLSWIL